MRQIRIVGKLLVENRVGDRSALDPKRAAGGTSAWRGSLDRGRAFDELAGGPAGVVEQRTCAWVTMFVS